MQTDWKKLTEALVRYSFLPNVGLESHTAIYSFVSWLHYCKTSANPVGSTVLFYLTEAVNISNKSLPFGQPQNKYSALVKI